MAVNVKEKYVQKAILQYLGLRGYLCWRNNTGGFVDKRDHFYQFGKVGSGDIFLVTKEGRFGSIEVKSKTGEPTTQQIEFMRRVNESNGIAFVARSVDDVIARGF